MLCNKKILVYAAFLVTGLWRVSSFAEDITLIAEDFLSETEKISENKVGGIGGEIVTKAFEAKKMTYKMVWQPWKRAQHDVQENLDKKSFIIPLTRNEERESSYNWTAKLYDAETAFFTNKGDKKINSFKEADGKKIGVLLGSSYEATLLDVKNGIHKSEIESVPVEDTNFKKLSTGKINSVYTGVIGGFAIIRALKLDPEKFSVGDKIDNEPNYIATVKSTPQELIDKVKNAIEDFKKTPEYAAIIKRYTGK